MKHILVIDDEKEICDHITTILEKKGAKITSASNLMEAKKLVNSQKWDAVISDVMLPHLGGFELTDMIKEGGSKTPVILITGMEKDILDSTFNTADLIITKPFTGNDIIEAVNKVGVEL